MGASEYGEISPSSMRLIRRKAYSLIGKHGFREDDREDLVHDLILYVLQALPHYDPSRASLDTYIARIVESKVATIVKAKRAKKRYAPKGVVSFDDDEPENTDDRTDTCRSLAETYSSDDWKRAIGTFVRSVQDQADLDSDVRNALADLSARLRPIADLLSEMDVTAAAKHLGVPRTTFDYWRRLLRRELAKRGLKEMP